MTLGSVSSVARLPWRRRPAGFILVAATAALAILYASSAEWHLPDQNVDAQASAIPGWHLVDQGSIRLDDLAGTNPHFVEGKDGVYSNRPPGLIGVAAGGYLMARPATDDLQGWTPTLIAVVLSALAVVMAAVIVGTTTGTAPAILGLVALGLGTPTWGVSAESLWPHGVNQFLIALALFGLYKGRDLVAGLSLGTAVWMRPPLFVVGVTVALALALSRRSWRPVFHVAAPGVVTLLLLMWFNYSIWGTFSPVGGYADVLASTDGGRTLPYLENLARSFVDPSRGILVWSPWLALAFVSVPKVWASTPDWARACAVAGLGYLFVHSGIMDFHAGMPVNYRFGLESLTLGLPVLALGLSRWMDTPMRRALLLTTMAVAVTAQGAYAWIFDCAIEPSGITATCGF